MIKRSATALIALRRILRVTELSSRALTRAVGLTPSQLILLQVIDRLDEAVPSAIAREMALTPATVTSILDRLERRGLVLRRRDLADRRRVIIDLTEAGRGVLHGAPDLLQDRFVARFDQLVDWEQSFLIAALERLAGLLDAEAIAAAPVLDVGAINEPFPAHTSTAERSSVQGATQRDAPVDVPGSDRPDPPSPTGKGSD